MHSRTSRIDPGPSLTGVDAVVPIRGAYPPPPPRCSPDDPLDDVLLRAPRTTRYGGPRGRRGTRLWTAASLLLAAAGVGVMLLPVEQSPPSARLAVPAAVASPVPAADSSTALPPMSTIHLQPGTPVSQVLQLPPSRPVRVQIPALGVTSRVMDLGLRADGSMEVPPGAYPVGWYDGSPTPGEIGPSVLAGHVDWAGKPGAFYGLRELRPGDRIVVDRTDGTAATFEVDDVEKVAKERFPTDEVYGDINHPGLRLITCGGAFDSDSGNYLDNIVVFASLVSIG